MIHFPAISKASKLHAPLKKAAVRGNSDPKIGQTQTGRAVAISTSALLPSCAAVNNHNLSTPKIPINVATNGPSTKLQYQTLANNFNDGDVIYGLDKPRAQALKAVQTTRNIERTRPVLTSAACGMYVKTKEKRNILIQNDLTNAVWSILSPNKYSSDKKINRELVDGKRGIGFRHFLKTHKNYNVATRPDPTTSINQMSINAWQRTSKAGLEHHLNGRKGTIHFIVSGLNIADVATKQGFGASITSAELRWLYRHKDVEDVKANLRFYTADGEISQREVFDDPAWAAYNPTHTYDKDWRIKT